MKALWRRVLGMVKWLGPHELGTLLMLAVVVLSLWGFLALAGEVKEGDTRAYDRRILLAFRNPQNIAQPIGPKWVQGMGRDFTALGGIGVLTFVTLAVIGFLLMQHKGREALLIVAAVGGGLLLSTLLKDIYNRPRPELVPHGAYVFTASFPSGHSMMSAVTYLTLGALLARVQPRKRIKIYLLTLASVLSVLIGLSRVYLGVHWPTDVLAGWTVGVTWALLCWLVARWLQYRGQIESDNDQPA